MSKPNIDLKSQKINFYRTNEAPDASYTGTVVQMKDEGSMSYGPSFESVKSISQFVDGKLHGDSYINELGSRGAYTITNHEAGNLVSENTFPGGSKNIREFRESDYDKNPNSILDQISFSSNDLKSSIDSELPTYSVDDEKVVGTYASEEYKPAFHAEITNLEENLGRKINQKDENGDLHGYQFITYSGMGENVQEHGVYSHGKKEGVWKWRSNNGKERVALYKDGQDIGGLELIKEKLKNLISGNEDFTKKIKMEK